MNATDATEGGDGSVAASTTGADEVGDQTVITELGGESGVPSIATLDDASAGTSTTETETIDTETPRVQEEVSSIEKQYEEL